MDTIHNKMKPKFWLILLLVCSFKFAFAQPWKMPISIARSTDGISFTNSTIFQDSSGVPCVIRWKGDTLICAFQWFRLPVGSPGWDRVAVKYSYDNGKNWTNPTPIVMNGIPGTYQRPFDPTLVVFNKDSIRIYFSSSAKLPTGGLDSIVNTYSAKSADGLNYTFEPNARVDVADKPVIDPAVVYFKNNWHYTAPAGAPQDGARHYTSTDGLHFSGLPIISSDNIHNWTGNLMVNNGNEMRFYGSGNFIWYNSSLDGSIWNGFNNTNIKGGDPSVIQLTDGSYLMIYSGKPNAVWSENLLKNDIIQIYPNPSNTTIRLITDFELASDYKIYSINGVLIENAHLDDTQSINIQSLESGIYLLEIKLINHTKVLLKFIKD